ncbi:RNA polymerase beta subunit [Tanacetum coccineum]
MLNYWILSIFIAEDWSLGRSIESAGNSLLESGYSGRTGGSQLVIVKNLLTIAWEQLLTVVFTTKTEMFGQQEYGRNMAVWTLLYVILIKKRRTQNAPQQNLVISKTDETEKTESIRVYILQKREIKVGDKVAGRHGNKGIISKILPRQDMPYLQDGRPVDMVFNPLGVPSRMNVGQIFESSLGLAGDLLDRHYRIAPFDERYEQEASRKLVFSELYEASKQTANPWIFEPESPGKSRIFDGRTGDPFEQPVIIGKPYILKLIHQVDDKIHGRSSGRYSRLTQQPLKGRAKKGGQRVGEMEVWALEGFGVAYILQEMLTYKSDHIRARQEVLGTIIFGGRIPTPEDAPESFRLFVRELRSLALELNHFLVSEKTFQLNRKEA